MATQSASRRPWATTMQRPSRSRPASSPAWPAVPSLCGIGDTVILVTATAAKSVREGIDFFPLTVDIEERMYAAGQDPRLVLPS